MSRYIDTNKDIICIYDILYIYTIIVIEDEFKEHTHNGMYNDKMTTLHIYFFSIILIITTFCIIHISSANTKKIIEYNHHDNTNTNNALLKSNNHNPQLQLPSPSSFGNSIVNALNNKLSKEFSPAWKEYRPYDKVDKQEGSIDKKNNNNNNNGNTIDIPKKIQDKINKEYIKQNQVELYDSYDPIRNIYVLSTKSLPVEKHIKFDFSFSSADGLNRCRVMDGKILKPMDEAVTEAARKKLHYNETSENNNDGLVPNVIEFLETISVPVSSSQLRLENDHEHFKLPVECSITGFTNIFTFIHYGYDMNDEDKVQTKSSSSWWVLYENENFKLAIETINVKVDFKKGTMVKSLTIRKKVSSRNDPSINKKNNENTIYHISVQSSSTKKAREINIMKKCQPFVNNKDENMIVSSIMKSNISFKIIYLYKDQLKLYISSVRYDNNDYLNIWLQHLDTAREDFNTGNLCTLSSLHTFLETKIGKPSLLNNCNNNNSPSSLRGGVRNVEPSIHTNGGFGMIIKPLPKLYEVHSKCSTISNIVANKNCISNMLRSPSHSNDILAIGKNEAVGYSFSKENIDYEIKTSLKNNMNKELTKLNKKLKTDDPWAIKIFYNFENDEEKLENWHLLKTIEKKGFQVVTDSVGLPSSIIHSEQHHHSSTSRKIQYRFVQSADSCKCCRDLFMRSVMLQE